MKNINFALVLILLACYSGFGAGSIFPSIPSNNSNCHSIKKERDTQNKHKSDSATYYLDEHPSSHRAFKCCFESLPNAPQKGQMFFKNMILDASLSNNPNVETVKHANSSLSVRIREHDPPNLFVSNSSLLL